LAEELEKMWGRVSPKLSHTGISKRDFLEFAFSAIKVNFAELHTTGTPLIRQLMTELLSRTHALVQQSHRGTLLKTLVPLRRVEKLTDLKWLVLPAPECNLVLADCVVLASTIYEDYLPMVYVGPEEISCVYFPITHDRILVGSRKSTCDIPPRLNEFSAAWSWSFFVARYQTPELAALRPRIRERIVAFVNRSVLEALSDSG